MEDTCIICGEHDHNKRNDHLRECFEMNQDGKWDKGLFQPRLNFVELAKIKSGFNYVCSNRTLCRKRQCKK